MPAKQAKVTDKAPVQVVAEPEAIAPASPARARQVLSTRKDPAPKGREKSAAPDERRGLTNVYMSRTADAKVISEAGAANQYVRAALLKNELGTPFLYADESVLPSATWGLHPCARFASRNQCALGTATTCPFSQLPRNICPAMLRLGYCDRVLQKEMDPKSKGCQFEMHGILHIDGDSMYVVSITGGTAPGANRTREQVAAAKQARVTQLINRAANEDRRDARLAAAWTLRSQVKPMAELAKSARLAPKSRRPEAQAALAQASQAFGGNIVKVTESLINITDHKRKTRAPKTAPSAPERDADADA